jgi:monoamine oxidase
LVLKILPMADEIIIIGAGATGLMAARQLASEGRNVLVLEANNRIGGRIHTVHNPSFPAPLEYGAEFVHGNLPLTLSLLDEAGIDYIPDVDTMIKIKDGRWNRTEDFIEGWDEMLARMKSVKIDMSLRSFLDLYYKESKYDALRKEVIRFAEGFDLADVNLVSMQFLFQEWKEDNHEQFRIPGGYKALTDYLAHTVKAKGGRIITGVNVSKVEWKQDKVEITSRSGKVYEGNRVIITVPIGVIQKINTTGQVIEFNPSISRLLKNTKYIGFGAVIKYFALFENFFSNELTKDCMILSDLGIPTWWVRFHKDSVLLTGWQGGPSASRNAGKSQGEYREQVLEILAAMFNVQKTDLSAKLKSFAAKSWAEDPFAYGAYSYEMVGSREIKKILRQPLAGTVFFAGEGVHEGTSPGTVEAALANGKEVAQRVLATWQYRRNVQR